jgi:hypothetical protein
MIETLKTLLEKHPEWADLPIVVYRPDGTTHYIGGSGYCYSSKDYEDFEEVGEEEIKKRPDNVLVFSPN